MSIFLKLVPSKRVFVLFSLFFTFFSVNSFNEFAITASRLFGQKFSSLDKEDSLSTEVAILESSVVEHLLAKENVESSNLFIRLPRSLR